MDNNYWAAAVFYHERCFFISGFNVLYQMIDVSYYKYIGQASESFFHNYALYVKFE